MLKAGINQYIYTKLDRNPNLEKNYCDKSEIKK